jgi:hypothetical protein
LVYLAHPVGLVTLLGIAVYSTLSQRLRRWWKLVPLALGMAVLLLIHSYVLRFPTAGWLGSSFYQLNGFDQFVLSWPTYQPVMLLMELAVVAAVLEAFMGGAKSGGFPAPIATTLGLWVLFLASVYLLPNGIKLPPFKAALTFLNLRSTCVSATLLLLAIGCLRPRRWHLAAFGVCALFFFGLLWQETGRLNALEEQAGTLLRTLPIGARVIATLRPMPGSRLPFLVHIVDRACIGHCFTYSNYEPSTGQFSIRNRPGSRTAASDVEDVALMQLGSYRVKASDLPLFELSQCHTGDVNQLCVRRLAAGELNCRRCIDQPSK